MSSITSTMPPCVDCKMKIGFFPHALMSHLKRRGNIKYGMAKRVNDLVQ